MELTWIWRVEDLASQRVELTARSVFHQSEGGRDREEPYWAIADARCHTSKLRHYAARRIAKATFPGPWVCLYVGCDGRSPWLVP
jgi:hypothetical protein